MKTLIINGSPRKNGDTVALINEMIKYLEGEVIITNTYYNNIRPCIDCRYCWEHAECALKDDMQDIYKLLNEVDNVILASPLYYSELTGSLLNFASRFQYFYASKRIRKDENFSLKSKCGVLILVGGGDTKDLSRALATANILFRSMGAKSIGNVLSLNTDTFSGKEGLRSKYDIEALKCAREMALKLNEKPL